MQTLEITKPGFEPHARLEAFSKGVLVAIELAEVLKVPVADSREPINQPDHDTCSLHELAALAYAALETGHEQKGFLILEGIGQLLGGIPRVALERALGLLRLKRTSQARFELAKALGGMTDQDGMMTALLAQLYFDARDQRWVPLAKRVLASALNLDARTRCSELLSARSR